MIGQRADGGLGRVVEVELRLKLVRASNRRKIVRKMVRKQGDVTMRNYKKLQALRIEIYTRNYSDDVIGESCDFSHL